MSDTLWIIIYTAGHIGGLAGPLPYDMDQCIERRNELRSMQYESLQRGTNDKTGEPLTEAEFAGINNMSFECEYRAIKPEIGGS